MLKSLDWETWSPLIQQGEKIGEFGAKKGLAGSDPCCPLCTLTLSNTRRPTHFSQAGRSQSVSDVSCAAAEQVSLDKHRGNSLGILR